MFFSKKNQIPSWSKSNLLSKKIKYSSRKKSNVLKVIEAFVKEIKSSRKKSNFLKRNFLKSWEPSLLFPGEERQLSKEIFLKEIFSKEIFS